MIHNFTVLEKILLKLNIIPHPLLDTLTSLVGARGLQVAVKIGVFDAIEKGVKTLNELALFTTSRKAALKPLIETLESLGYIKFANGELGLTRRGKRFLLSSSEQSLKNVVLFSEYVFSSLMDLERNIKLGPPETANIDLFNKKQWNVFNKAMLEIAKINITEVIDLIPIDKSYERVLDLGGSHGLHSIELCKKFSSLRAEVMDLKPVKSFAEKLIKQHRMEKRVKYKVGDILKDDIGKGYDVILAFNLIHGFDEKTNISLTKRIYESLNPGGVYVILDQINEARGKSELSKLVASTQGLMLFNVAGGRTYSFTEISAWLNKAGFDQLDLRKLRNPGNAVAVAKTS